MVASERAFRGHVFTCHLEQTKGSEETAARVACDKASVKRIAFTQNSRNISRKVTLRAEVHMRALHISSRVGARTGSDQAGAGGPGSGHGLRTWASAKQQLGSPLHVAVRPLQGVGRRRRRESHPNELGEACDLEFLEGRWRRPAHLRLLRRRLRRRRHRRRHRWRRSSSGWRRRLWLGLGDVKLSETNCPHHRLAFQLWQRLDGGHPLRVNQVVVLLCPCVRLLGECMRSSKLLLQRLVRLRAEEHRLAAPIRRMGEPRDLLSVLVVLFVDSRGEVMLVPVKRLSVPLDDVKPLLRDVVAQLRAG
mmetsp:Transcript_37172/g.86869  ORF Transcript_37172/g.86869 Transcript_37172/m.86869 type:complete len:306 (-) Transcript_37172:740-1657(-)